VEKYRTDRQATDDNMTHARRILDTEGYKHTLRILLFFHCNSGCTNELQSYAVHTVSVLIKLRLLLFSVPKFLTVFILAFRDERSLVLFLAALTAVP